MGILQSHIDKKEGENQPEVLISTTEVIVHCNSGCVECQYSIADESGRIVKKGLIQYQTKISLEDIAPGFYSFILFNEFNRFRYPIRVN